MGNSEGAGETELSHNLRPSISQQKETEDIREGIKWIKVRNLTGLDPCIDKDTQRNFWQAKYLLINP